jgi:hypothetical protein
LFEWHSSDPYYRLRFPALSEVVRKSQSDSTRSKLREGTEFQNGARVSIKPLHLYQLGLEPSPYKGLVLMLGRRLALPASYQ